MKKPSNTQRKHKKILLFVSYNVVLSYFSPALSSPLAIFSTLLASLFLAQGTLHNKTTSKSHVENFLITIYSCNMHSFSFCSLWSFKSHIYCALLNDKTWFVNLGTLDLPCIWTRENVRNFCMVLKGFSLVLKQIWTLEEALCQIQKHTLILKCFRISHQTDS